MPSGVHEHNVELHESREDRDSTIYFRYMTGTATMQELADDYDVTKQRIAQILDRHGKPARRRRPRRF